MKKHFIVFLYLILSSNAIKSQSIDHGLKFEREGLPFHKSSLNTKFLQNTFNDIHDTSDYLRYHSIDSILTFRYDTLPGSRVWGDTVINLGEQIVLIHYNSDSIAKAAFDGLIYYIKNPNLMMLLYEKGGLVLGITKNIIAIYQPNVNPLKRKKTSLNDICKKFDKLGYYNIHFQNDHLEKYK